MSTQSDLIYVKPAPTSNTNVNTGADEDQRYSPNENTGADEDQRYSPSENAGADKDQRYSPNKITDIDADDPGSSSNDTSIDEEQISSPICHACEELKLENKSLLNNNKQLEAVNQLLREKTEGQASSRSSACATRDYDLTLKVETLRLDLSKVSEELDQQKKETSDKSEEIGKLKYEARKMLEESFRKQELWKQEKSDLKRSLSKLKAYEKLYYERVNENDKLKEQKRMDRAEFEKLWRHYQEQKELCLSMDKKLSELMSHSASTNAIVRTTQQQLEKQMITFGKSQGSATNRSISQNQATAALRKVQHELTSTKESKKQIDLQIEEKRRELMCIEAQLKERTTELTTLQHRLISMKGQFSGHYQDMSTEQQLQSANNLEAAATAEAHKQYRTPVTPKHNFVGLRTGCEQFSGEGILPSKCESPITQQQTSVSPKRGVQFKRSTEKDYDKLSTEYEELTTCPDSDAVLGALEAAGMTVHDAKCVLSIAIQIFYNKSKEYLLKQMSQQLHRMFQPFLPGADDRLSKKKEMDLTSHAFGILLDVSGATAKTHDPQSLAAAQKYLHGRIPEKAQKVFVAADGTPSNHCKCLVELVWKFMVLSKPMILFQPREFHENFVDKSASWNEHMDFASLYYQRPALLRSYSGIVARQGWATNVCPEALSKCYEDEHNDDFHTERNLLSPDGEKVSRSQTSHKTGSKEGGGFFSWFS